MVCDPLLKTLNSSSPLLSNKAFCLHIKSIEDQNQKKNIINKKSLYCNLKGFVIVFYGCPLTNYTCGLKSKNALCSKKTRRTAKLNQSKKSIKLKKTNELRQHLKQLRKSLAAKSKLKKGTNLFKANSSSTQKL